ncbi:MAG: FHA domain-containing protein, partial [Planctomycetes bacterium]|nr:FHA domain-containing protein [Planctomycetota bacterium]
MPYFEVQLTQKLQRIYEVQADTIIGRAPQCVIQLLSRAVSRRHARIEFDGQQAIISDLGTKNGIKLNGQRVQGAAVVSEGDEVIVGDIHMRYRGADRSIVDADVIDLRNRAATPQDLETACREGKTTFLLRAHVAQLNTFQSSVGRGRIQQLEFPDEAKFKLQIALREAIENARAHGCNGDPNRFIHVTFLDDEDEFVMSVKDEGEGFSLEEALTDLEEVDALEAVRNRQRLGKPLGFRILLDCVDRLQFEGRGTTIHLGLVKEAGELLVISEDEDEEGFGGYEGADPNAEIGITPASEVEYTDPFATDEDAMPDPFATAPDPTADPFALRRVGFI